MRSCAPRDVRVAAVPGGASSGAVGVAARSLRSSTTWPSLRVWIVKGGGVGDFGQARQCAGAACLRHQSGEGATLVLGPEGGPERVRGLL